LIELLIRQFGVERVRSALDKVTEKVTEKLEAHAQSSSRTLPQRNATTVTSGLEKLKQLDEGKYTLLSDFYRQLRDGSLLPEAQDIRHYAQMIGLKEISGKSRKDMIRKLMLFLFEQPAARLKVDLQKAASVSEQQRGEGFSILTDKLLREK
jgi:hypothetical protein